MTIQLVIFLSSSAVIETLSFDLPFPMEIFKAKLTTSGTQRGLVVVRDSEVSASLESGSIDLDKLVVNSRENELLLMNAHDDSGVLDFVGFGPIKIYNQISFDHVTSGGVNQLLYLYARQLLGEDEISSQLERDLAESLHQVGKPEIHWDEATGTYLDQDGNTVDFSDQEQILLRSVRQVTREQ